MREYFAREGQRYVHVSPGARYERDIQRLVARNLPALFPEYVGVLFEPLFSTPAGDVKPDLVMVRHDGLGWGLVEVEVEGHSFSTHILPQLSKLTFAESYSKLAAALVQKMPELDSERIRTAVTFRPTVFLVMQGTSKTHDAKLTKLGVEVRDIDVLEASDKPNEYMLVVMDRTIRRRQLPEEAHRDRTISSIWMLKDPSLAGIVRQENRIEVEILGTRAMWTVSVERDGKLLLRQPSLLSDEDTDINSIVRAKVFVDDEHGVLYLEPAGSLS